MTLQEHFDIKKIEEDDYWTELNKRLDEQSRNRTPEESRKLFTKLGILDENGHVAEGREALVWLMLEDAAKLKSK